MPIKPAWSAAGSQNVSALTVVRPGECPVIMPSLGGACSEGTVIRWLKEEGEYVEAAEPLLEVSSGMTSTEILSPAAGIVRDIATAEDETAPVGAQLAMIKETRATAREPSAQAILSTTIIRRLVDS
jgi:pyruvate/2-oxoglutarate dehydrogenase complex dihydrolipoamide acyltransferase (E2) component